MKVLSIIGIVVSSLAMLVGFVGFSMTTISDAATTTAVAMYGIVYLLSFAIYGLVMSSKFEVKNIKILSIIGIVICAWILSSELLEDPTIGLGSLEDWQNASVGWGIFNLYGLAYSITSLVQSKKFNN